MSMATRHIASVSTAARVLYYSPPTKAFKATFAGGVLCALGEMKFAARPLETPKSMAARDNQVKGTGDDTFQRFSARSDSWYSLPMPDEVRTGDHLVVVYRQGCPHSAAAVNLAERLDREPVLVAVPISPSDDYNDRQAKLQRELDEYPAVPRSHTTFPAVLVQKKAGHALYIGGNDEFQSFARRMQ